MFSKTIVLIVLSMIIFRGSHLLPPTIRVLEVNISGIIGISILITESKIHISYLKHHDWTLILSSIIFTCYPFRPSSISLLYRLYRSISSPFRVTKLQKNCLDVSSTSSFPFSMSVDTHILIPYKPYGDEVST